MPRSSDDETKCAVNFDRVSDDPLSGPLESGGDSTLLWANEKSPPLLWANESLGFFIGFFVSDSCSCADCAYDFIARTSQFAYTYRCADRWLGRGAHDDGAQTTPNQDRQYLPPVVRLAVDHASTMALAQRSVESPPRDPESGSSETRSKLTAHFVSSSLGA